MRTQDSNGVRFYSHITAYEERENDPLDAGRAHSPEESNITIGQAMSQEQFYLWESRRLRDDAQGRRPSPEEKAYGMGLLADWRWHDAGEPECRIMPAVLPSMLRGNLSVPSSRLRLPYSGILIRLPIGHRQSGLLAPNGEELRTIMVCEVGPDSILFWMDTGSCRFWYGMPLTDEEYIAEIVATSGELTSLAGAHRSLIVQGIRVAAMAIFGLRSVDAIAEADVGNRDVWADYESDASEEGRE